MGNNQNNQTRFHRVVVCLGRFARLLGLWGPGLVLLALLTWVPLTVFPWMFGYGLSGVTRGLFVGLTWGEILCATFALTAACSSWVFVFALMVEGVSYMFASADPSLAGPAKITADPREKSRHYLPCWAVQLFRIPLGPAQFVLISVLALPGTCTLVTMSVDPWWEAVGAVAVGAAAAVLLALLAGFCTRLAAYSDADLGYRLNENQKSISRWILHKLRLTTQPVVPGLAAIRDCLGRLARRFGVVGGAVVLKSPPNGEDPREVTLHIDHFAALIAAILLVVSFFAMCLLLNPDHNLLSMPSAALLFVILTVAIWHLAGLHFHLAPFRFSALLLVAGAMLAGYWCFDRDHEYAVTEAPNDSRLTAKAIVKTPTEGPRPATERSLVVVTTTGGGIWAAGWTTWALARLYEAMPSLAKDLRVISGVSGGAVGTAFYVNERLRDPKLSAYQAASNAFEKATTSSLEAVSYGLAFRDLPTLISGGMFGSEEDRGTFLEDAWCRTSNGSGGKRAKSCDRQRLADVASAVAEGSIPLPIFNTAVMETGKRLMVTPMKFGGHGPRPVGDDDERGWTLDEYLYGPGKQAQIDLWTAARLAATFPYISPATRASDTPAGCKEVFRACKRSRSDPAVHCDVDAQRECRRGHHMIDGGYYDNYGVASALDWLNEVLGDATTAGVQKVLIVQLRAFRDDPVHEKKATGGAASALVGPLLGILNIRTGAARQRNDIDLHRFISMHDNPNLEVDTVVFQPPDRKDCATSEGDAELEMPLSADSAPLNWRLTPKDIEALKQSWPPRDPSGKPWPCELETQFQRMKTFLGYK